MECVPLATIPPNTPLRRLQQVSNLATRPFVTSWMVEDVATHGLANLGPQVIQAFPKHFRGQRLANLVKASRWWQQRCQFHEDVAGQITPLSCSQSRLDKRRRHSPKARPG